MRFSIVALVAGIGAIIVGGCRQEPLAPDRKATIALSDRSGECPIDRPVAIRITNVSDETLNDVWFTIEGRAPGHSTKLALVNRVHNDTILAPGQVLDSCAPAPEPLAYYPADTRLELAVSVDDTA